MNINVVFSIVFLCSLIIAPTLNAEVTDADIQPLSQSSNFRADFEKAWGKQRNLSDINKVISALEARMAADSTDTYSMSMLSRALFIKGLFMDEQSPKPKKDTLRAVYKKGIETADKCEKIDPKYYHCTYWKMVNMSAEEDVRGVNLGSLSLLGKLKDLSAKVDAAAPGYFYGGTTRFWGRVIYKVPGIVRKMAGSDIDESVDDYEKSLRFSEAHVMTHVYFAETLIYRDEGNDRERAKALLEKAMNVSVSSVPDIAIENVLMKEVAKKIYNKNFKQ